MLEKDVIDHEIRIRMLEELTKQINSKMNAGIMLLLTGIIIPIILKYLGV
jgi:hypothetical protein